MTITNSTERPAVYKIKTTSPDKYKVRPSMYCLGAGSTNVVEIAAQSTTAAALVRDKFLITAVAVEQEGLPANKIAEIMKVLYDVMQHVRLMHPGPIFTAIVSKILKLMFS